MDTGGDKRTDGSKDDEELSQLLDSSLQDFGKANVNACAEECQGDGRTGDDLDIETARKAASDFQKMLQQLSEIQKVVMQQVEAETMENSNSMVNGRPDDAPAENQPPVGNLAAELDDEDNLMGPGTSDDMQMAEAFLKNMQRLAEKAQKVQEAKTDDDFSNAMKQLSDDDTYESEFMPFMHGLMGSLLSREMLHPPLKEMCDKYPAWLLANKGTLDEKSYENYEKQLAFMREACHEYELEKPDESDQDRAQRMERLMICMQQIQACGYPPEDLVGALPPGWSMDAETGLPKAVDVEKAADACCIM